MTMTHVPSPNPFPPADGPRPQPPPYEEVISAALAEAYRAYRRGDPHRFAAAVTALLDPLDVRWRTAVERPLSETLRTAVTDAWQRGWQPADLLRLVRRRFTDQQVRLLKDAIAAELQAYPTPTIDRRWLAQLAEAEVKTWWPSDQGYLRARSRQPNSDWPTVLSAAVDVLCLLWDLPMVEHLSPLPGTAQPSHPDATSAADNGERPEIDPRMLSRIRQLLAKAEATSSQNEAEALTAAAQERMARYSIDQAMLADTQPGTGPTPSGRRIGLENPYEEAKALLLDQIASVNRCRSVWTKRYGFSTVIGFGSDLDVVEALFTSLRVQAVTAMNHAGDGARTRTRGFRRAFLTAYAHRIGERLNEVVQAQTRAATAEPGGGDLLPVLASRQNAIEDAVGQMFPQLGTKSTNSGFDREGWYAGQEAADLASLQIGSALPKPHGEP